MADAKKGDETNGEATATITMLQPLPYTETSHRSVTIIVPAVDHASSSSSSNDPFANERFCQGLSATIDACRAMRKSSIWIHVPMSRCAVIEIADLASLGFQFHHARGADDNTVALNLWLDDRTPSKIPEFATHHVGVGAVVINSRDEILCVRELRKNYMPWKTPTGLSNVGESIDAAAVREVREETGIATVFRRVLGFRQTHGMTHDRSDLYFVCQLDPVETVDAAGNVVIAEPKPEASEIAKAEWIPLNDYRAMVNDPVTGGHPMMKQVLEVLDSGRGMDRKVVRSVVPGRPPNDMYLPN
jgi:ADP-ribose pyrophosphatase YjhB (NUDIX family)